MCYLRQSTLGFVKQRKTIDETAVPSYKNYALIKTDPKRQGKETSFFQNNRGIGRVDWI